MKTLLLDANAIIDFFSGVGRTLEWLGKAERVIVPAIVVGEVEVGAVPTRRGADTMRALERLLSLPRVEVHPVTRETASFYAIVYRHLRNQGTPVPDNDMWIAACALETGATICTSDRHFSLLPLIKCVDPRSNPNQSDENQQRSPQP